MKVHIFDKQQDLKISRQAVKDIVKEVLRLEGKSCDEVAIHFVDPDTIASLHERFFDDPTVTDCVSFPIDDPDAPDYCVLGEVFVCPHTAIAYAKEHQTAPSWETTLYIVHGMLHLLGYDDQGLEEPQMRAAEAAHMKNLECQNLILDKTT